MMCLLQHLAIRSKATSLSLQQVSTSASADERNMSIKSTPPQTLSLHKTQHQWVKTVANCDWRLRNLATVYEPMKGGLIILDKSSSGRTRPAITTTRKLLGSRLDFLDAVLSPGLLCIVCITCKRRTDVCHLRLCMPKNHHKIYLLPVAWPIWCSPAGEGGSPQDASAP
jgi:hypothetical protein